MDAVDGTAAAPETNDPVPKRTRRVLAFCRRYWWLFTALVVGVHVILWALNNPQTQTVHWIIFTTDSSLGVVIAVAVILGAIFGHLISYQRRSGGQKTHVRTSPTPRRHRGHAAP